MDGARAASGMAIRPMAHGVGLRRSTPPQLAGPWAFLVTADSWAGPLWRIAPGWLAAADHRRLSGSVLAALGARNLPALLASACCWGMLSCPAPTRAVPAARSAESPQELTTRWPPVLRPAPQRSAPGRTLGTAALGARATGPRAARGPWWSTAAQTELGLNKRHTAVHLDPQRQNLLLAEHPSPRSWSLALTWAISPLAPAGPAGIGLVSPCCWRCASAPGAGKNFQNLFALRTGPPGPVNLRYLGLKGALESFWPVGERCCNLFAAGREGRRSPEWAGAAQWLSPSGNCGLVVSWAGLRISKLDFAATALDRLLGLPLGSTLCSACDCGSR